MNFNKEGERERTIVKWGMNINNNKPSKKIKTKKSDEKEEKNLYIRSSAYFTQQQHIWLDLILSSSIIRCAKERLVADSHSWCTLYTYLKWPTDI